MKAARTHTLAAAVLTLAATAPLAAQAQSVEMYGVFDGFAGRSASSGKPADTVINSGGMTTSFWGVRGSEPLGGQRKVHFALESFVRLDTGETGRYGGDPIFARAASISVTDSWGEAKIGRMSNLLWVAGIGLNPFGASTRFSPLQVQLWTPQYGGNMAGDSGWSNAVAYFSPGMGGVTVRAQYALGETGANARNVALAVSYAKAPLAITVAAQEVRTGLGVTAAAPRQNSWMLGGAYDLKLVKLYATYHDNRTELSGRRTRTAQAGASAPVGRGAILLSWAHTKEAALAAAPFHRDTAAAGYDYNLSTRTDLYTVYLYDKKSSASSGNSWGAGIRHRF